MYFYLQLLEAQLIVPRDEISKGIFPSKKGNRNFKLLYFLLTFALPLPSFWKHLNLLSSVYFFLDSFEFMALFQPIPI